MPADAPVTTLDPDDPYLREAQTFPRLNEDMARRVAAYGVEEPVSPQAMLFERGQRGVGEGSVVVYAIHRFLHPGEA